MRIVLDLSTSYVWNRPPVGIVRTEQRFAQYLLAQEDVPAAFCRFDRERKAHVPVTRDEAAELVHFDIPAQSSTEEEAFEASSFDPVPAFETAGVTRREAKSLETTVAGSGSPAAAATGPVRVPPPIGRRQRAKATIKRAGHRVIHAMPDVLQPQTRDTFRAGKVFAKQAVGLFGSYARWLGGRYPIAFRRDARSQASAVAAPVSEAFEFARTDIYCSMGLDWEYNDMAVLYRERRRVGFRTLLFCYDTIPVLFPHLMSFDSRQHFARYFADVAHTADRVVAISNASRHDLLELLEQLGAPQPPADVVHLGAEIQAPASAIRSPDKRLQAHPFVLYVSTIEARKNHELLYNVWDRLVRHHGDALPYLVFVGMRGWGTDTLFFKLGANPRLRDRVIVLDNLPDEELLWLYRNCLFTVFPSLYEGWGLPVVESLAYGKPCLCSTAPAVLEAAQGMAQALDPLDTPRWSQAIETLWQDEAARQRQTERLRSDFRAPTWRAHGDGMLAVIRDLATTG